MAFERRRTDFARNCLEFFDECRRRADLEGLLDAVQLLLDLRVIVACYQHHAMQQVRLGEWLFPIWFSGAGFDGVADGAWACCIADGVCFHAVCVVAVGRVADVFGEDSGNLNRSAYRQCE